MIARTVVSLLALHAVGCTNGDGSPDTSAAEAADTADSPAQVCGFDRDPVYTEVTNTSESSACPDASPDDFNVEDGEDPGSTGELADCERTVDESTCTMTLDCGTYGATIRIDGDAFTGTLSAAVGPVECTYQVTGVIDSSRSGD